MDAYESEFTKNRFHLAEKANAQKEKAEAAAQHRRKAVARQKDREESVTKTRNG